MQQNKIHILHTRRDAGVNSTDAKHIVFDTIPFIRIVLTENEVAIDRIDELLQQEHVVVFTSANAVRSVARYRHGDTPAWKIYCIGGATKAAVERYFSNTKIIAVADNAHALAHVIVNNDSIQRVVFFCGDKRRDELPGVLLKHDVLVEEVIVYQAIATPQKIEKQYDGISFFSASAADSFFSVNSIAANVVLFAIGETTAAALKKYAPDNTILVCKEPSVAAMDHLIINNFKTDIINAG